MDDEKMIEDAFQKFKARCLLVFPQVEDTEPPSCATDTTLRRFWVARKHKEEDAFNQYTAYRTWARKINLRSLAEAPPPSSEKLKKLFCFLQKGIDKEQGPVYIERLGACNMPALRQLVSVDKEFVPYHAWKNEQQLKRTVLLSDEFKKDIHKQTVICDLAGLGMQHRFGMDFFAASSLIDERYYPETIKKVFCVNVPWVFPAIYAIAKAFIDADTVLKIEVLSGDAASYSKRLLEFVDADQLPVEYGGTAEWKVPEPQHELFLEEMEQQLMDMERTFECSSVAIPARSLHTVDVDITGKGMVSWFFRSKSNDIEISVHHDNGAEAINVHPPEKKEKGFGSFPADSGKATLTLSNNHSLIWGKKVKYCFWFDKDDSKE